MGAIFSQAVLNFFTFTGCIKKSKSLLSSSLIIVTLSEITVVLQLGHGKRLDIYFIILFVPVLGNITKNNIQNVINVRML